MGSITTTILLVGLTSLSSISYALTVPFNEDFESGISNWQTGLSVPATLETTGGADDGQYVSTTADVADTLGFGGQTIFRCHASSGCSNGEFVGDWASAVGTLAFDIRHDATDPLGFFVRIATPGNFPAWTATSNVVVQPNTWTTISININENNPVLAPEFGTFAATFGNVGNLQFGVSIPDGFVADNITFDIDRVSVAPVPLPAAAWLLLSAAPLLLRRCGKTMGTT